MTDKMLQALINVQTKLKAPKGRKNNFGGYQYRSCEDILEAVKPILAEEKLFLFISDEIVQTGDRYYIKATATITDGKDTISNTAYARESEVKKGMDDSQITGTSSSYARKYALNGLLLIDDTKDADTDEYHNETTEKLATDEEKKLFMDTCKRHGEDYQTVLKAVGVNGKMTKAQYTKAMKFLKGDKNV